jgi:hypothetical protein
MQHAYYGIFFRGYTPGLATAVLLLGPLIIGLTVKAIRGKLVPWWYVAILYLLVVPTTVSTVRAAHHNPPQLPPQLIAAQERGVRLARAILGRN